MPRPPKPLLVPVTLLTLLVPLGVYLQRGERIMCRDAEKVSNHQEMGDFQRKYNLNSALGATKSKRAIIIFKVTDILFYRRTIGFNFEFDDQMKVTHFRKWDGTEWKR